MRRGMLAMVRTPDYPNEIPRPGLPTNDPLHCWFQAAELFSKIREQHDFTLAQEIFAALGAPSPKRRREFREMQAVRFFKLRRLAGLNLEQISRMLAARNKNQPKENRISPTGSTDPKAIRVWLTRVLKKRGINPTKPRARKPR